MRRGTCASPWGRTTTRGRRRSCWGSWASPTWGDKAVRDYSGGMRRRLALARALLFPCDILLLDEPFTGLDPENRRRAAACVRRHGAGKIVFVVTHEASDAEALEAEILRL